MKFGKSFGTCYVNTKHGRFKKVKQSCIIYIFFTHIVHGQNNRIENEWEGKFHLWETFCTEAKQNATKSLTSNLWL